MLQKIINCLHWTLAFRRLREECFCGGITQKGDFATPFIISNIDQWITSKLQATISINNTLINGSRTLVNSIKKASCVNRHHGADWQCHLPTKGCNGQSGMGVWGATSSVNISPPNPPHQSQPQHSFFKNHQNKHFWLIFGVTNWKQIKANGHWAFLHLAFSRACSQMETHFLACPVWLGDACFFPALLQSAQMDAGVQLGPEGWGLASGPSRLH